MVLRWTRKYGESLSSPSSLFLARWKFCLTRYWQTCPGTSCLLIGGGMLFRQVKKINRNITDPPHEHHGPVDLLGVYCLGVVPDDLVGQTIGPLNHSRWLTRAVRTLAKWARTRKPTKSFHRIVFFILNLYLPGWFRIKSRPHCQEGARHFQYLLELSRDLSQADQVIVQKVMQDNAHWAHPENVIISCLADTREEIRRKAVQYIMRARSVKFF